MLPEQNFSQPLFDIESAEQTSVF